MQAAKKHGAELAPPLIVPAALGVLGTFGAITRIRSTLVNREALLEIGAAGPLAGASLSLALVLIGLAMAQAGVGSTLPVDSVAFQDSFLIAVLGENP